jgi:hypothetical protein
MIDPSRPEAVLLRAKDRMAWTTNGGKSLRQISVELTDQLMASIVALFDLRQQCSSVSIALTTPTSVTRVELLEDSMYLATYHGPDSSGHQNPYTMRYPRGSQRHLEAKVEIDRELDIAKSQHRLMEFDWSSDETELIRWLGKISGSTRITQDEVDRLRALHAEYTRDFSNFLHRLRY